MKVFLDDAPLSPPSATLESALDTGRSAAEATGRVIVEVWADGAPAPDEDLAEPPDYEPYARELRLVSVEPRELVRTTLEQAAGALGSVLDQQRRAAQLLQTGQTQAALNELGEAMRVWESVRRAVQDGCALLGEDPARLLRDEPTPDDPQPEAPSLEQLVAALAGLLVDVKRAVTNEDWSDLADVLEFDLHDEAQRWGRLLERLAARV